MKTKFILLDDLGGFKTIVADQVQTDAGGALTFFDIKPGSQGVLAPSLVRMFASGRWGEVTNGGFDLGTMPQSSDVPAPDAHAHHEVDL